MSEITETTATETEKKGHRTTLNEKLRETFKVPTDKALREILNPKEREASLRAKITASELDVQSGLKTEEEHAKYKGKVEDAILKFWAETETVQKEFVQKAGETVLAFFSAVKE